MFSIIPYSELALNKGLCNEQIPSFRDQGDCEAPRDKDVLSIQCPGQQVAGQAPTYKISIAVYILFHLNILRCCQRLPKFLMLCYLLKLRFWARYFFSTIYPKCTFLPITKETFSLKSENLIKDVIQSKQNHTPLCSLPQSAASRPADRTVCAWSHGTRNMPGGGLERLVVHIRDQPFSETNF